MIFFDYYFRDFSIPKVLAPLADCMKSYQSVLVADLKAFDKVVDELKEKYNAIPKAEERFSFHVSEGSLGTISVSKITSTFISAGLVASVAAGKPEMLNFTASLFKPVNSYVCWPRLGAMFSVCATSVPFLP